MTIYPGGLAKMQTLSQQLPSEQSPKGQPLSVRIEAQHLSLHYGHFHALKDVSIAFPDRQITALIGPSGCGKSTLLRCLDRMNDEIAGVRISGKVLLDGQDIYARPRGGSLDVETLRRRVGMVFQRPNPFPLSVFDNIAYGLRVHGLHRQSVAAVVERSLRAVNLWEELKDQTDRDALELSGEQQQRLCIARVIAVEPEVLLMDEPCSALDPVATLKIEELMHGLAERFTIVVVTHNMQQAARVSSHAGYMLLGELLEFGKTEQLFTSPRDPRTEDYISGRFG
jgi:phosphate transport system ATP-binding protein